MHEKTCFEAIGGLLEVGLLDREDLFKRGDK